MPPHLVFDVGKLEQLKTEYQASLSYILEQLPPVNWNSPKQIKEYFQKNYQITLPNVKITTFAALQLHYEQDPELLDLLTGVLQYLKHKSTLNNYILCILRHLEENRFYLRDCDGVWKMPNHQAVFHTPEIWACVKSCSAELVPLIEALNLP